MNTAVQPRNSNCKSAAGRHLQTPNSHPSPSFRDSRFPLRVSLRAFTLLEVLVATGVLAVMVTILFALFAEGSNAWRMGEKVADVNQGVRTAMGLIAQEASMAVIDTTTNANLKNLSVVIQLRSAGDQPADDPLPYGRYEDLCFIAPVEIGNDTTNSASATSGYRSYCGVRYYVAKAPPVGNRRSQVLGNLTRVVYTTINKGNLSDFYTSPWSLGAGVQTNSAVIAENVLSFRVQPAQNDPAQGLRPANSQMFSSMNSDQSTTIDYNNFSGKTLCYPGIFVGLCVVDSRTANRINQLGLNTAVKTVGFQASTNWTLIHFESFNP